jgi:hypothetical protein
MILPMRGGVGRLTAGVSLSGGGKTAIFLENVPLSMVHRLRFA